MHAITLKTETETKLTFELTFDHAYALTTPYGIDAPSDMLSLFFDDFIDSDPSEPVSYDLTVFTDPNDYYFATQLTHRPYGSDCADYDSIDDLTYAYGQPVTDFVTAELTRRNLPLVASRNWPDF